MKTGDGVAPFVGSSPTASAEMKLAQEGEGMLAAGLAPDGFGLMVQ